jgi:hypothetical protein
MYLPLAESSENIKVGRAGMRVLFGFLASILRDRSHSSADIVTIIVGGVASARPLRDEEGESVYNKLFDSPDGGHTFSSGILHPAGAPLLPACL